VLMYKYRSRAMTSPTFSSYLVRYQRTNNHPTVHQRHRTLWVSRKPHELQHTLVFPEEDQMRLAGQASRSNKFEVFWTADNRNISFLNLEGYLGTLALRVAWPSFGNTTVCADRAINGNIIPLSSLLPLRLTCLITMITRSGLHPATSMLTSPFNLTSPCTHGRASPLTLEITIFSTSTS
jgi:hypothetical protein